MSITLIQLKQDALNGLKAGQCPKEGIKGCLKAIILDHIHELNNLDRMRAVLDEGVLDHDKPTFLHNLHFLLPIAEAEVVQCETYSEKCFKAGITEWAKTFKDEAKEWSRLAKKAAVSLGVEPDLNKRHWYGVSQFHGFREKIGKDGQITREGGYWSHPKHGQHHAFLTPEDAQAYADTQYAMLKKWSLERHLEVPYRVEDMGVKSYEEVMK